MLGRPHSRRRGGNLWQESKIFHIFCEIFTVLQDNSIASKLQQNRNCCLWKEKGGNPSYAGTLIKKQQRK